MFEHHRGGQHTIHAGDAIKHIAKITLIAGFENYDDAAMVDRQHIGPVICRDPPRH